VFEIDGRREVVLFIGDGEYQTTADLSLGMTGGERQ